MAKPPAEIATLLAADPRADAGRVDRLHITLLPLGLAQAGWIDRVRVALDGFVGTPFRVNVDRIHCSGKTVALRGSDTMRGAIRAQARLRDHLIRHGLAPPAYAFRPHITLAYRPDHLPVQAIDAIGWRVEDIRLIESVTGQGRHLDHGRWRLGAAAAAAA